MNARLLINLSVLSLYHKRLEGESASALSTYKRIRILRAADVINQSISHCFSLMSLYNAVTYFFLLTWVGWCYVNPICLLMMMSDVRQSIDICKCTGLVNYYRLKVLYEIDPGSY